MRKSVPKQACRITDGPLASSKRDGFNGAFSVSAPNGARLSVICSDGTGWQEGGLPDLPWEHVSVSTPSRCPSWEEMDFVKRLFWRDDETVIQFHVPRSQHISHHDYCLHLWKPPYAVVLPPSITVAPQ